ncbi:dTDP-4-dehydrorhamnose 3,5-epimerase [Pleionea litopenaei]|uniref:dTDP-4-dehydrorhamnose 3,5-epimerase n=1 Tax=Pleionea litopenaei TaxID=3070815 RepID=A0AA51X6G6_9GAMM|nr:dTDP-4-dehydrorhamnose 3,5-epimerase [Pleionea sp. HL-JVS1]WMS87277.1 dTDP-4-dehydrorhamnose 3,5-epimerase [Pleionea sp. HL-JVS1]
MKLVEKALGDVALFESTVFGDDRGFFFESYNEKVFNELVGYKVTFKQDNHSKSQKGVLRGLHYQLNSPQGKLVRVIKGSVFDVAVDLRRCSSTFGQWYGVTLSSENKNLIWVPPGFAHGFVVLEDETEVLYKATEFYAPKDEYSILYNDQDIGINWPKLDSEILLSAKDTNGLTFAAAPYFK